MTNFNRLECVDCVVGVRSLSDGSVPLTVTSPPYDQLRDFAPFDFENLAHELYRVTAPGGVVVWVVGDQIKNGTESGTSFKQALFFMEVGFRLHHTMIFEPLATSARSHNRYGSALQFMFVLSKGKPRVANLIHDKKNKSAGTYRRERPADKYRDYFRAQPIKEWGRRGAIWQYPVGNGCTTKDRYAFEHKAMFPEALARDHIVSWSRPGDVVLDPFSGAATTAKMALLLGRRYLGFEIDPEYHELGLRRVKKATDKLFAAA